MRRKDLYLTESWSDVVVFLNVNGSTASSVFSGEKGQVPWVVGRGRTGLIGGIDGDLHPSLEHVRN